MTRIRFGGFAESTLIAYAEEDWTGADGLGDPGIAAVCVSYVPGALLVTAANLSLVLDGLTSLSNTEDEISEEERKKAPHRRDVERMKYARAASDGLTRLAQRVGRVA